MAIVVTGGNDREESLLVVVSREAIGVHDVAGIDFFLPLGGIQPLRPLRTTWHSS